MTAITANNFLKQFPIIGQIITQFILAAYIYSHMSYYGTQRYQDKNI